MKNKPTLWNGVSVLAVAVLVITAFARGTAQIWLYAAAFTVWAVWAAVKFLVPWLQAKARQMEARRIRKQYEAQQQEKPAQHTQDISEPINIVLLRHVNFRISSYLKSAYPDATWEWREEFPERIISEGGTGRIQVYGIADFNYADVTFDQQAGIHCSLLKMVPLAQQDGQPKPETPKPPKQAPVDPQIWYEKQGRTVLENLIADLNSRGHNSLTIRENGEITIMQADSEVRQAAFESVPEKTYWPRLTKVLESEGLAAKATENGMVVSW